MKIKWWQIGLILCLLVVFISPLASSSPDGLERVAEDQGFISKALEAPLTIIPDYIFPGIRNEAVATVLAGLLGTLALFGMVYGIAWLLKARKEKQSRNHDVSSL